MTPWIFPMRQWISQPPLSTWSWLKGPSNCWIFSPKNAQKFIQISKNQFHFRKFCHVSGNKTLTWLMKSWLVHDGIRKYWLMKHPPNNISGDCIILQKKNNQPGFWTYRGLYYPLSLASYIYIYKPPEYCSCSYTPLLKQQTQGICSCDITSFTFSRRPLTFPSRDKRCNTERSFGSIKRPENHG